MRPLSVSVTLLLHCILISLHLTQITCNLINFNLLIFIKIYTVFFYSDFDTINKSLRIFNALNWKLKLNCLRKGLGCKVYYHGTLILRGGEINTEIYILCNFKESWKLKKFNRYEIWNVSFMRVPIYSRTSAAIWRIVFIKAWSTLTLSIIFDISGTYVALYTLIEGNRKYI